MAGDPRGLQDKAAFRRIQINGVIYPLDNLALTTPEVSMGFAGGIKPENVEAVLQSIGDRPEPFWIDMESGVRTNDKFDLTKCRQVLEKCRPWIAG